MPLDTARETAQEIEELHFEWIRLLQQFDAHLGRCIERHVMFDGLVLLLTFLVIVNTDLLNYNILFALDALIHIDELRFYFLNLDHWVSMYSRHHCDRNRNTTHLSEHVMEGEALDLGFTRILTAQKRHHIFFDLLNVFFIVVGI